MPNVTKFENNGVVYTVKDETARQQVAKKVNAPLTEYNNIDNGTEGQVLRSKGNGKTEWADMGLPTEEQTAEAVNAWLDAHPEATTTVQDNSLTLGKLAPELKNEILSKGTPSCVLKYVKGGLPFSNSVQSFCKMGDYFYVGGFATGYLGYIVQLDADGNICHTFEYPGASFTSLTGDGEKLYAVVARSNETTTSNQILVINPSDWTYNIISFGVSQVIAAYYFNGELYVQVQNTEPDRNMTIYKYLDRTQICTIPDLEGEQHRQTFMMDENYIYVIYSNYPQIGRFDYNGNLISCIDVGERTSDGYMPIYELENGYIDADTGNFIIGANGIAERRGGNKTLAVYEISLTHNLLIPDRYPTYGSKYTIYADNTASWERPTGSWGRSYPLLAYAICSAAERGAVVSGKQNYPSTYEFPGVYTVTTDMEIRLVSVTGFYVIRSRVTFANVSMTGRSNIIKQNTSYSIALSAVGACEITMTNCSMSDDAVGNHSDYITDLSAGTRFYCYGFTNNSGIPIYAGTSTAIDGHSTLTTSEITSYMPGFITNGPRKTQNNTTNTYTLTPVENTNDYTFNCDFLKWSADNNNDSLIAVMVSMISGQWCSWITLANRPNAARGVIANNGTVIDLRIARVDNTTNQYRLYCSSAINASSIIFVPISPN